MHKRFMSETCREAVGVVSLLVLPLSTRIDSFCLLLEDCRRYDPCAAVIIRLEHALKPATGSLVCVGVSGFPVLAAFSFESA